MKRLMTLALLAFSLNSFASIELRSEVNSESCIIKGEQVIKTTSMLDGELKVTTTGNVRIEGLEQVARRAIETNTGTTNDYYNYEIILDGKSYTLSVADSKESMVLVRMMSNICNAL